jgi:hypothetical protein
MIAKPAVASLLAASICTGCAYNYTFMTSLPPSSERISKTEHQALFGWVSNNVLDLDEVCPAGVSEFGSYIGFFDWLPAFFTLGLYTPRTAYAICAEPTSK